MGGDRRGGKRILVTLMIGTVLAVVGYGTAVAANVVNLPMGDVENPNASPSPLPSYTVSVELRGSGYGLVVSDPVGIRCGHTCSATFPAGTLVTLHSSPGATSVAHLGEPCSGEATCSFHVDADMTIGARFVDESVGVTVSIKGHGTISAGRPGLHCPGHCSHRFREGGLLRLFAHAARGWHFEEWSGDCSGKHVCVVHLNETRHATAHFARKHP